jgi:radical SAM superfamily enzyme YgiQ (UPF0313 family)
MCKVLFVYPNKEGYPIIPLGISVLSGILKRENHIIDLFDITFMVSERLDHNAREKTGVVDTVNVDDYWGSDNIIDIEKEFKNKIMSFKPDIIAFSIVENNYGFARKMFKMVKQVTDNLIIVGGIFPTIAPDFFIKDNNVDIICRGEGEYALLELANRVERNEDILSIPNLIIKKSDKSYENNFTKYYDWKPFTCQDWSLFDPRHLDKPFMGKMWKTGFFEMSRGCPFNCSYCANHIYQKIFKDLGKYRREKPVEYCIREIEFLKELYSLELIFFNDENFLMMSDERFEEFYTKYEKRINLPFFIQTKAEHLNDEAKVKKLSECNCITIGIGVESGSEKIRREILGKKTPDSIYIKAFKNCNKYNIRTTAYIMMGLPFETEEDILLTADFCKRIKTKSIAISIFAPYYGSKLRDICIKEGYMEDRYYEDISVNYTTILDMPQLPREKIEKLYYSFNDLVYS